MALGDGRNDQKGNTVAPVGETPAEKFKRISEPRINNAVDELRKLTNLANKSEYAYTPEEIDRMFKHIDEAVLRLKIAYEKDFMADFKW